MLLEQELQKWGFSKGHRSTIPPEEGALKTCFPEILSLFISVDLKWRGVKGERGKGKKVICPDGNVTFNGYRHCRKADLLKSTGKASASGLVCTAGKIPTEMHVQPLCIQIPAAVSFPLQQLSPRLVPTTMVLPVRGRSRSKTAIAP